MTIDRYCAGLLLLGGSGLLALIAANAFAAAPGFPFSLAAIVFAACAAAAVSRAYRLDQDGREGDIA